MFDFDIEFKDFAIVLATILGPILAVQAQKMIERYKERRSRKLAVFEQLMATRAARLSPEHVQALNMIDLVFYGKRFLSRVRRSWNEQAVLDCWKEYLDLLSTKPLTNDDAAWQLWTARGDELLTNLLFAIAQDVGYDFDRVQLKKGAYSPEAHGSIERENRAIREGLIQVLAGQPALKVEVSQAPGNDTQRAMQSKIS